MVANPGSMMATKSNDNNSSGITINASSIATNSEGYDGDSKVDNKLAASSSSSPFFFLHHQQNNSDEASSFLSSSPVVSSSRTAMRSSTSIDAGVAIKRTTETQTTDTRQQPHSSTEENTNEQAGLGRQLQEQQYEEQQQQQHQQTRFCFYNADDFVIPSDSKTPSPQKITKLSRPKVSLHRSKVSHETTALVSNLSIPSPGQETSTEASTATTKRRFNFYDAREVKVTQTILTTVAAQEIGSDACAATVENLLYLSKQNSAEGSGHENNSDSAGDTVHESNLNSIEILKSLQEHEQQRLEILGNISILGKPSTRPKKSSHPVLSCSISKENNNKTMSSTTVTTTSDIAIYTIAPVVSNPCRNQNNNEQVRLSEVPQNTIATNLITTSNALSSTSSSGSNNFNQFSNVLDPNGSNDSNPYEDAIKEALLLIRRHRKESGRNDSVSGGRSVGSATAISSVSIEPPYPMMKITTASHSQAGSIPTEQNMKNENMYQLPSQNPQNQHLSRQQLHLSVSSTISDGHITQSSTDCLPKKPILSINTDDQNSFYGEDEHDERDHGNGLLSNPNYTPSSDIATGLLGDAYQVEIEARRRQRQERMAKYANRLAELKQEGHASPPAFEAGTQSIIEPVVPVVPTAAAGLIYAGPTRISDDRTSYTALYKIHQNDSSLLSTSMKSPTISIDTADMYSWYEDESNHPTGQDVRIVNDSGQKNDDRVIAARSPPGPDGQQTLTHGIYETYDPSANQSCDHQPYYQKPRSETSHNSIAYTSHEQEIQLGVERVLLAILERANSSSRGRSRKIDGEVGSSLQPNSNFAYIQPTHANCLTLEEKKSANPTEDVVSPVMSTESYRPNHHQQCGHHSVAVENPKAEYLQHSFPDESDVLVKALSDLLRPTSVSLHSSGTTVSKPDMIEMRKVSCDNDTKSKDLSVDYSFDPTKSHTQQYVKRVSNVEFQDDEDDSIDDDAGDMALLRPDLVRSEIDTIYHQFTTIPTGTKSTAQTIDEKGRISEASLQAHLELDRLVEKVYGDTNDPDESCSSSVSSRGPKQLEQQIDSKYKSDRYQVSSGDDEEAEPKYLPLGTNTSSFSRSQLDPSLGRESNVSDSIQLDRDNIDNLDFASSKEEAVFHNDDNDNSSASETDCIPGDCDEASYIESSDEERFEGRSAKQSFTSRQQYTSGGVLGPRSKRSGGTTGVVLDDDSSSSDESEVSNSSVSSADSSKSDEDDEDDLDSSRNGKISIRTTENSATSPSLFQSLSAAVSLVTGVTSYDESKLNGMSQSASMHTSDKSQLSPSSQTRNKKKSSFDDEIVLESDESTDSEAVDLMLALCAHLLPVGVDSVARRKEGGKRILEALPNWDDANPDEPGYRIVRLNSYQLHRVQSCFDKMVDFLEHQSRRSFLKQSVRTKNVLEETAFERDLKEAEDLLDEEERVRGLHNTCSSVDDMGNRSASVEKSMTGSDSRNDSSVSSSSSHAVEVDDPSYDEAKKSLVHEQCLKDFRGAKSVGKGEMGELEFFSLPIIFKSHVTGFEPTKDLILEPGNVVAGQYLVEGILGSAAFSTAYKCLNLNADAGDDHERHVCLKVIKNTKDFFDQSLDEIKILELLRQTGKCHEMNLIEMKSFFYHREHLIIVTELLRQNLFEFGKFIIESGEEPYFTIPRLSYIARQCLIGLNFVHKLSLVHSDVKPENILLASYSRALVKVIDFGSSCWLTDRQSSYIQSRSYRAPEVVLGLPYDGRIDVWSLGCVVAEMYTGEVTFQNDSIVSMLSRIEAICGPFPRHMIANGRQSSRYFTKCGLLYERVPAEGDDSKRDDSYSDDDINYSDVDDEHTKVRYIDVFQPKKTTLSSRLGFGNIQAPSNSTKAGTGSLLEKIFMKVSEKQESYPSSGSNHKKIDDKVVSSEELSQMFIDFVRRMLTIDPESRPTAEEALRHPLMKFAATLCEEDVKYPSTSQ